jgi:UDP-sulfoquinovose synthase
LGYTVTIADNYARRDNARAYGMASLFPLPSLHERVRFWQEKSGEQIRFAVADLARDENMRAFFDEKGYERIVGQKFPGLPDAVFHLAEQPSAPFSHIDYKTSGYTVMNNLAVTHGLLCAVRDLSPETHIIHIGTMGEYGTPNIDIEEGWIDITHKGRMDRFLFPRQAGSVYHTTKIMDTDLMWLFVRQWGLRITDLMQGPVYGMLTGEIGEKDESLYTTFNYDKYFGTVLNRFMVQAIAGYPLTVYGKGGQTRGYLNINDTLQCLQKSCEISAEQGELRIFNQITETFSVNQLAERVAEAGKELGLTVEIDHVRNPRKEAEEHYYNPTYQGLKGIGVNLNPLTTDVLVKMLRIVEKHKNDIDKKAFV